MGKKRKQAVRREARPMRDKFNHERRFCFKCRCCGTTNFAVFAEHYALNMDTRAKEGSIELNTLDRIAASFRCGQCHALWREPKPRRLPPSYITSSIPNSLDPYERAEQMQALAEAKQRRIQAGCKKWKRESLLHKWGFNRQEAKGER